MTTSLINRTRIAAEFDKMLLMEESIVGTATLRGAAPPHLSFAVLYHQIAADDVRHLAVLQKIAIRYGATPSEHHQSGVGEVFGRIKNNLVELGASPSDRLRQDLLMIADAIHWQTAWMDVLKSLNDDQSATEMASILKEDLVHHDALLEALKRVVKEECHE